MMDFILKYKWKLVGVALGALAGFAYWYFIGCNSGSCAIQSNWESSTLYGVLIGFAMANGPKKSKSKDAEPAGINSKKVEE